MFQRGVADSGLFGAPVVLPSPEDLFAHLLLHATLHWLNRARLHRPEDFEAVSRALALDVERSARHLVEQGLLTHARLILPLVAAQTGGTFVPDLARRMPDLTRARVSAWVVRALVAGYPHPGHAGRRLAGLALAPSLSGAIATAIRDRLESSRSRPTG
jgi:hypothetical protein